MTDYDRKCWDWIWEDHDHDIGTKVSSSVWHFTTFSSAVKRALIAEEGSICKVVIVKRNCHNKITQRFSLKYAQRIQKLRKL
jgi:hypothetical protein